MGSSMGCLTHIISPLSPALSVLPTLSPFDTLQQALGLLELWPAPFYVIPSSYCCSPACWGTNAQPPPHKIKEHGPFQC